MSQEKVDKRKAEKANRQRDIKREKARKILRKVVAAVVVAAVLVWIGISQYNNHEANKPRTSVTADYSAVDEYVNSLGSESAQE